MSEIGVLDNPYEGINWSTVDKRKLGLHIHTGQVPPNQTLDFYAGDGGDPDGRIIQSGDEYDILHADRGDLTDPVLWNTDGQFGEGWDFSEIDSEWEDRNPADMGPNDGVLAFSGAEGTPATRVEHLLVLFSTISFHDIARDITSRTRSKSIKRILNTPEFDTPDPLIALPHPSTYGGVEDLSKWFTDFDDFEGLIGIEALSKESRDNSKDLDILDMLSTRFSPKNQVWALAAENSKYGLAIGIYGQMDTRFNTVLFADGEFNPSEQTATRQKCVDIIKSGATLIHNREEWDADTESPPTVPTVNEIEVSDGTISIDADDYQQIHWISRGETVATGDSVELEPAHAPYVRASIRNGERDGKPTNETLTQPFGLDVDLVSTSQDVTFGGK